MVICVGEILADMIAQPSDGILTYGRYAGGAPFNVACGIAKLGGEAGFYGRVGDDLIGDFLISFAQGKNLAYCNVKKLPDRNTTLAFVELDGDGDRHFCFYRKHTADYCFDEADIPEILEKANIIYVGSLALSEERGRQFMDKLIAAAKSAGKKICYDVNYRDDIFPDAQRAKEIYAKYIGAADIVKLSEEEVALFSAKGNIDDAVKELAGRDKLVFVTLGAKGSLYCLDGKISRVGAISLRPVDTTGAGDAYFAGVLSVLDKNGFAAAYDAARTGSICGSLTTLGKGAVDAFPAGEEVQKLISMLK